MIDRVDEVPLAIVNIAAPEALPTGKKVRLAAGPVSFNGEEGPLLTRIGFGSVPVGASQAPSLSAS